MSKIYASAIIGLLAIVLPLLGLEISDNELLNSTIEQIVVAIAFIGVIVFRVLKGDVSMFGVRKN